MQAEANTPTTSPKSPPRYMRRAVGGAALVSVATLIGLLLYASFANPPGPAAIADSVEEQLFIGAFATAVSIFPLALFVIRWRQWSRKQAKHPSVPLCLLATAALIPFMFSVGILFLP